MSRLHRNFRACSNHDECHVLWNVQPHLKPDATSPGTRVLKIRRVSRPQISRIFVRCTVCFFFFSSSYLPLTPDVSFTTIDNLFLNACYINNFFKNFCYIKIYLFEISIYSYINFFAIDPLVSLINSLINCIMCVCIYFHIHIFSFQVILKFEGNKEYRFIWLFYSL